MTADATTGYPYTTYCVRTHFALSNVVAGTSLSFSGFIDDGAVVYLNGAEVYRLRVPAPSTTDTLALGYPCDGDATCLDEFTLEGDALASLRSGDNVLAVEVHNYNARSADITFGLSASRSDPAAQSVTLHAAYSAGLLTLTWDDPAFALQSANSLEGPWYDAGAASPVVVSTTDAERYYRVKH